MYDADIILYQQYLFPAYNLGMDWNIWFELDLKVINIIILSN